MAFHQLKHKLQLLSLSFIRRKTRSSDQAAVEGESHDPYDFSDTEEEMPAGERFLKFYVRMPANAAFLLRNDTEKMYEQIISSVSF